MICARTRPVREHDLRGAMIRAALACLLLGALSSAGVRATAASLLFVGNSFTYAQGSAVRFYRSDTVTDLNDTGIGGVPALFKSFADQAGIPYDVYLETEPGVGLDWHLEHKLPVIGRRSWDTVVLQGYSTLDKLKPGDPAVLIASVARMADALRAANPAVDIRLMATWPRADQVYDRFGAWFHRPIEAMAHDIRSGYDRAAAGTKSVRAVVPVGEAWIRAIHAGIADSNPYDGIDPGKIDLWATDNYHASTYGYYLEALTLFGDLTGRDPRSLGGNECSGFELGLTTDQIKGLQQAAFDQLQADGALNAGGAVSDLGTAKAGGAVKAAGGPTRCARGP